MLQNIAWAFNAHQKNAITPEKSVRRWDKKTPYVMHPIWCAMTLLAETRVPEKERELGYQALLFHDMIEETTKTFPQGCDLAVVALVEDKTFPHREIEMQEIWNKKPLVILLTLIDKTSNLMDGTWMDAAKHANYVSYVSELCEEVERLYGELNITRIARALCVS